MFYVGQLGFDVDHDVQLAARSARSAHPSRVGVFHLLLGFARRARIVAWALDRRHARRLTP